jgi:hypothetical protein
VGGVGVGHAGEFHEGVNIGYRGYIAEDVEPAFAFRHGLWYTEFEYDRLRIPPMPRGRDTARVRLRLTNTGDRDGSEVVGLRRAAVRGGLAGAQAGRVRQGRARGTRADQRAATSSPRAADEPWFPIDRGAIRVDSGWRPT